MKITKATAVGRRDYQEDRMVVHKTPRGVLLAILDGHGGAQVSDGGAKRIARTWGTMLRKSQDCLMAMKMTFDRINQTFRDSRAGSTLSVVWIPASNDVAWVGVLGDSPVVILKAGGKELSVSPEHNVRSNVSEANAAMSRGGVIWCGYLSDPEECTRHASLQMSRALGNRHLDRVLSREPEIYPVPLDKDSYVLVASDGVFDPGHADLKAAVKLVHEIAKKSNAKAIVKNATDVLKTGDNASAILVKF
jgi:serine/threonine protein phosphatase PrpC